MAMASQSLSRSLLLLENHTLLLQNQNQSQSPLLHQNQSQNLLLVEIKLNPRIMDKGRPSLAKSILTQSKMAYGKELLS